MIPKLPTYAKGDSIGIAVCPTGVSLDEVEIDMLVYTTGNGPRIYGSTQGRGLPIVKGADRAVFNIPSSETRKLDAGIVTLETTYTIGERTRTLTDRIAINFALDPFPRSERKRQARYNHSQHKTN